MIAALIGMIPGLLRLVEGFQSRYFDAKVRIYEARTGADRDAVVNLLQRETAAQVDNTARLSVFASNKLLTALIVAAAIPILGFEWKVIVWDNMLGWGTTDPIKGQVAAWADTIIYFLFGAPTTMGLAKMWFNRKGA